MFSLWTLRMNLSPGEQISLGVFTVNFNHMLFVNSAFLRISFRYLPSRRWNFERNHFSQLKKCLIFCFLRDCLQISFLIVIEFKWWINELLFPLKSSENHRGENRISLIRLNSLSIRSKIWWRFQAELKSIFCLELCRGDKNEPWITKRLVVQQIIELEITGEEVEEEVVGEVVEEVDIEDEVQTVVIVIIEIG